MESSNLDLKGLQTQGRLHFMVIDCMMEQGNTELKFKNMRWQ